MAHVKAGGTSKNNHDSPGQRLGVKLYANQKVKTGQTIVRQIGLTKRSGIGTSLARDFTIYASKDGVVRFQKRKVRIFTGKTVWRTEVTVE